jgi:hypothetical protein
MWPHIHLTNLREKLKSTSRKICHFTHSIFITTLMVSKGKVKWSRYRPGMAQRVGRGIALLFHDRGTRRGWVVSSMAQPHFTPGKDPVPILQGTGWAPGPVWTGGKSRPHPDSVPDRPACSQSLYQLSYPAHNGFQANAKFEQWVTAWRLKSSGMLCHIQWTGTHISHGTASSIFRVEKSGLLFYPRPRLVVPMKCLCLFITPYCVTKHCNCHIYCNKNLKSHTNLTCTNTVTRLLAGWPP